MKFLSYLKSRLNERSSWIQIGAGVAAAAALSSPFSYLFIAIGVIGVLVPDLKDEAE